LARIGVLEATVVTRSLNGRQFQWLKPNNHISSMLAHMTDEDLMQQLIYVYIDLTTNSLHIMTPELKDQLREWLAKMKETRSHGDDIHQNIKYVGHRDCSLKEVWDAEPHWEFWERCDVADEISQMGSVSQGNGTE
jgi:hypothetical protein